MHSQTTKFKFLLKARYIMQMDTFTIIRIENIYLPIVLIKTYLLLCEYYKSLRKSG